MILKCFTKKCRKPAKSGKYCYSCRQKRYKEKNPEYYAFYVLKNNAKRRGVVFGLTFEDFKKFAIKTNYMKKKGTGSESLHIDRIDEKKGYFKGNIQVLSNSDNVKKYLHYYLNEKGKPVGFKVRKSFVLKEEDYPY
jgi:hypothetical protein